MISIQNRQIKNSFKGSIYKATVSRIESSLDAAFVNFGSDRHGFLPLKDLSKNFIKRIRKENMFVL